MTPICKTFIQPSDSCSDQDVHQTLVIEATDAGGGTFVVLTTERWAMDTEDQIDELCVELKAMLKVNVLPKNDEE